MKRIFHILVGALMIQFVSGQIIITEEPESRTAAEGRRVSFSVQAQGTAPLSYQWQFNGIDLPGQTTRSLSFYATLSRAGSYSVTVRDGDGSIRSSSAAQLNVQRRPVILAQPRSVKVGEHQTAVFEVRVNDSAPYNVVQWWHHSLEEPHHPIPSSAARGVNTFRLEILDANNNGTFNGQYWVVITNEVGWAMSRRARLTVVGPPVLTREPLDRTVRKGRSASFAVAIAPDAAGPKTKQWYRNGQPIAGATGKVLTIVNAQADDQAVYSCIVTSIGGSITSSTARLTVY